jgi:hypothetical protein
MILPFIRQFTCALREILCGRCDQIQDTKCAKNHNGAGENRKIELKLKRREDDLHHAINLYQGRSGKNIS